MKKHVLLLSFFLLYFYSYSQYDNLKNSQVVDTIKYLTSNYQFQDALEYIQRQEPTRSLLVEKALCYKSIGDYNRASVVLLDLDRQYPNDLYILNELASTYQILGKWGQAEQFYNQLIEIDSTNIYYKLKKGDMLFNQSQYSKAINTYKQIYSEKQLPTILKQLGCCHEAINLNDSAKLYYNKAWISDSSDSQVAILYANFSLKIGDIPTTLSVCNAYLEQDSTNSQLNRLHALAYYINDEYQTAATLFEKCVSQGDSTLLLNRSLGICYYLLKEPRAYDFLCRAYEQDTTNNNVLYSLATVCNDMEKSREAIHYYSILLGRVLPKNSSLYLNYHGLAIAYAKDKEYAKAIDNYEQAINYGTENQSALMRITIAEIYDYNLHDRSNALKYYTLYCSDLEKLIEKMKGTEVVDFDELNDVERRLKNLNEYKKSLED